MRCSASHSNPRDYSSYKVQDACIIAERHGYRWIWNDGCCIDKTSNSELSEAINSMSSYYARSEVCYAYLKDVHPDPGHSRCCSASRASVWFKRGWTLQELLAPEDVVFLAWDWSIIGTKAGLSEELERITMVPQSALRLEEDIWIVSVAQRMSWAAHRATTRPEDEAYCLMGIFDINMPPLYGEGRNAFCRLQEEIMRKSIDTSLFARSVRPWHRTSGKIVASWPRDDHLEYDERSLLAPGPARFFSSRGPLPSSSVFSLCFVETEVFERQP
ncbi:hypothetical protein OH76DRAFT_1487856 [Lentinus brumalis]|uniref:Uncharacterized protein n=1 Tax=Lentinus brumalis TaxID=2498619 RepID=A0A371CT73_9APHY|nr:hypothetical protein OH76DRAFT_1487856 [Polyporus brumalis]